MEPSLQRLYPLPVTDEPLTGCYLRHALHRRGDARSPFVYTNFIQTLDGRVAVRDPATGRLDVPGAAANARDWRLYLELAAQADVLLTTGRHLRALAAGRQTGLLELPEDLCRWRREQGLTERPAVAAVTGGGEWLGEPDLPEAVSRVLPEAPWLVVPEGAATAAWEAHGLPVVRVAGEGYVPGEALVRGLAKQGLVRIYSIAGPGVCHALADSGMLDRLYLTQAQVVVGGEDYESLARGPLLHPALHWRLLQLRHDGAGPGGAGQLFQVLGRL